MTYSEFLSRELEGRRAAIRALLGGFSDAARVAVLAAKAGDTVLHQGDARSDIYVLVSGRASTVSQHAGYTTYAFDEFGPVALFGEQEALAGYSHIIADVRAKTDCRFLVLREPDYLRWVQSDTAIMQRRVRTVLNILFSQLHQERSALFLSSEQRMRQFLAAYYERRQKSAAGGTVTVRQTRPSIAEETSFSLRTVNRIVQALKKQGGISLCKGKIAINEAQYRALKAQEQK